MNVPEELRYTENDEWIRVEGDVGTIGVTDYAQDELSDIVYVEVTAKVGDSVQKGETFGVVESVKAAADVYLPVSGEVIEINEALPEAPEKVNSDPYGEAWMLRVRIADSSELDQMMDASAYRAYRQE